MNVALIKTKAEQTFAETFDRLSGELPGGEVVRAARRAAMAKFGTLGLPHRRIEEWKYTDLRNQMKDVPPLSIGDESVATIADVIVALGPLAQLDAHRVVFVNGRHRPELSSTEPLEGLEVASLAAALASGQEKVAEGLVQTSGPDNDAVLALNTAYMSDGALVRIAGGAKLSKPVVIAQISAGPVAGFTATRNVINVGKDSEAAIIEAFVSVPGAAGGGQTNAASEVSVGDGAHFSHVKCVAEMGTVTHLANWMVSIGKGANYRCFQLTQGVGLARNQVFADFRGEDAKVDISGAFLARGDEHIDTTLVVEHAVPSCESRELFKGVLNGRARGIFQGKVIVRKEAQKTDGKQMAKALMLSPDAEFDSKPELEIYADDVVCGHGSTVAEIDEDLLFYCQSRGIPTAVAKVLLTESFIGEAIEQVEDEEIREALMVFARNWLEVDSGAVDRA